MPINFYPRLSLTGGVAGSLDNIDGALLQDTDITLVGQSGSDAKLYILDDDSGAAESSPGIISPDSNAGTKRWILLGLTGETINAQSVLSAGVDDTSQGVLHLYSAAPASDTGGEIYLYSGIDETGGWEEVTEASMNHYGVINTAGSPEYLSDGLFVNPIQNFNWLAIDLGAANAKDVTRLRFYLANEFAETAFKNQVTFLGSNNTTDGTDGDWTTIISDMSSLTGPATSYPGWTNKLTFSNGVAYRWYKIVDATPGNNTVVYEWELEATVAPVNYYGIIVDSDDLKIGPNADPDALMLRGSGSNAGVVTTTTLTFEGGLCGGTDGSHGGDVYFYSGTAGDYMQWDASDIVLNLIGTDATTVLNVSDGNVVIADTLTATGQFASMTGGITTPHGVQFFSDGNNAFWRSTDHGAAMYIQGEDGAGVRDTLFKGTPGAAAELYYNNIGILRTTSAGIEISDDNFANVAALVYSADDLYIRNEINSGDIYIQSKDAGGTRRTGFHWNPDGSADLYYTGYPIIKTEATGLGLYHGTSDSPTINFYHSSTALQGYLSFYDGDKFYIRWGSHEDMISAVENGAVTLYYDDAATLATKSGGVTVTGDLGTDTITMTDAGKQTWDAAPASDDTCSGDISSETVDTNSVGIGAVLVLSADGNWDEADQDAEATVGLLGMAVESGTGTKNVMHNGWIHLASHGFTVGAQLFVSGTQGTMTNTVPGSGKFAQVCGYATDANTIRFNPSPDYIEVT
jgi:hypothetical protein